MRAFFFILAIVSFSFSGGLPAPSNPRAEYTETGLDITWDSVPGARGYNLYDRDSNSKKAKQRKINSALITSGPHFSYLWDVQNGERVRRIKGYEHHISITAVFNETGNEKEGPFSDEVDNCYFEGFRNVLSGAEIKKRLVKQQASPLLPVDQKANSREDFIRFMEGPGARLAGEMKKAINPREVGACAPISTIVVKLLDEWGLPAFRVEGVFIKEFHTFNIINIEGVEYVLDFTADQFAPGVSPVFFPRDYSNLNTRGRLSVMGTPVYQIGKVFTAAQTALSENKEGEGYRRIYDKVVSGKTTKKEKIR